MQIEHKNYYAQILHGNHETAIRHHKSLIRLTYTRSLK